VWGQDIVVFREICMKHASQAQFGRPMTAVRTTDLPDKWTILKDLTAASEEFGLTHRTLNVLRALMTFLPETGISTDPAAATVFPANRTLSARLNGMPESTLRRHLAQLVAAGIVSRSDSPNRKRYARRMGGGATLAFGFDLSPLAEHAARIAAAARRAAEARQHALALRDRVALLRQTVQMQQDDAQAPLLEEARLLLRRKPDVGQLQRMMSRLQAALPPVDNSQHPALASARLSGTDSQNERHIQDSDKADSDSEGEGQGAETQTTRAPSGAAGNAGRTAKPRTGPTIGDILGACTELATFFPQTPRDWPSLLSLADRIGPMLGIDPPVLNEARRNMGADAAALVVICMLERSAVIRRPGAYLRRLSQKAAQGEFSIAPMLNALIAGERRAIVS
jgi:replication initiation protein RepC